MCIEGWADGEAGQAFLMLWASTSRRYPREENITCLNYAESDWDGRGMSVPLVQTVSSSTGFTSSDKLMSWPEVFLSKVVAESALTWRRLSMRRAIIVVTILDNNWSNSGAVRRATRTCLVANDDSPPLRYGYEMNLIRFVYNLRRFRTYSA
jgi:hypothetical protein